MRSRLPKSSPASTRTVRPSHSSPVWRAYTELPNTGHVVGDLRIRHSVWSPQLRNRRDILVHLPPSYATDRRRYPVLYIQDGQNLFDPSASFAGEWEVDETMEEVARVGLEAIVVGIPNMGPERCDEYSPWIDAKAGGGRGDGYVAFVANTLKPLIDRSFRTRRGPSHTGIVGSSMGGLISLYALFRRPDVFGSAGVMSPALWFAGRAIFPYLKRARFVPGRIYLDVGTKEGWGELADVRRLHKVLLKKGYHPNHELLYVIERGAGHNEAAWARRFRLALPFLLRGERPTPLITPLM